MNKVLSEISNVATRNGLVNFNLSSLFHYYINLVEKFDHDLSQTEFKKSILDVELILHNKNKQYINLYDGWQGLTNADNYYNLYGAGIGFKWAKDTYQLNASLAIPIGNNPLYSNNGTQVNVDNRQINPQLWVQGIIYF